MAAGALPSRAVASAQARASTAGLTSFFIVELLIVSVMRLPTDLGFTAFAYADRGSWMTVIALVEQGRRPALDFGYSYGLLPIWLSRGWFAILGATPITYETLTVALSLSMGWAFARIIRALDLPRAGFVLAVIALPFAIMCSYLSIAHAAEAALLCNALAEQAAGRRSRALALAAAACFAKPSMGYVYGAILLLWIIIDGIRREGKFKPGDLVKEITPAACMVVLLAACALAMQGPRVFAATILPLTGMRNYAEFGMGFFHGRGSYFWYGVSLIGFFTTVLAFWFAASGWLIGAALVSLARLARGGALSMRSEIVITTALMHVAFVAFFFAGPAAWTYYSYVLLIGVLAACAGGPAALTAAIALTVVTAVGQGSTRAADLVAWRMRARDQSTAQLWATPAQRNDWNQMRAALHGERAALITPNGDVPLLFSEFQRTAFAYLLPGITTPRDLAAALAEFEKAPLVVELIAPDYGFALTLMPELQAPLRNRTLIFRNGSFAVYR